MYLYYSGEKISSNTLRARGMCIRLVYRAPSRESKSYVINGKTYRNRSRLTYGIVLIVHLVDVFMAVIKNTSTMCVFCIFPRTKYHIAAAPPPATMYSCECEPASPLVEGQFPATQIVWTAARRAVRISYVFIVRKIANYFSNSHSFQCVFIHGSLPSTVWNFTNFTRNVQFEEFVEEVVDV